MEPKTYTVTIRIGEQQYIVGHYLASNPRHAKDAAREDLAVMIPVTATLADVTGLPYLAHVQGTLPEDLEPIQF